MAKRTKTRASLSEILASCSDTLFPAEMGAAPVTVSSQGSDGDTPLHVMLWREDTYAVLQLIEAGADVNAVGDMSETPLHIAVRKQNLRAIEALLKAGAKTTLVSEFGQTSKDSAMEIGGAVKKLFVDKP